MLWIQLGFVSRTLKLPAPLGQSANHTIFGWESSEALPINLLQSHLTMKPKYYDCCIDHSLLQLFTTSRATFFPSPLKRAGAELKQAPGPSLPPPVLLFSTALFLQGLLAVTFCQTITQQLFIFSILPLKDGKLSETLCSSVLIRKKISFLRTRLKEHFDKYWKITCANLHGPDPQLLHRATQGDN